MTRQDCTVFLGYQFKSAYFEKAQMDHAVSVAVDGASDALSKRFAAAVSFSPIDVTPGQMLLHEVQRAIRAAAICIFEVSDLNNNVFYELGFAEGLGIPTILLVSKSSGMIARLPSDLRGVFCLEYSSVDEVRSKLGRYIADAVATSLARDSEQSRRQYLKHLWLGDSSTDTVFVSGEIRGSNKSIGGFVNYVRNGDARALLESVITILSIDNTVSFETTATEFVSSKSLTQNIIVIGGPKANQVTKSVLEKYQTPWQYRYQAGGNYRDKALCNSESGVELRATLNRRDEVLVDYGMILIAPNPFNPVNNCVLLTGLYTFGVLGGVKAISLTDHSDVVTKNVDTIWTRDRDRMRLLQVIVQTDVVDKKVITPTVRPEWIEVREIV